MNKCTHSDCSFDGWASLLGGYVCKSCGQRFDPVVFHKIKGKPHILFKKENEPILLSYLESLPQEQRFLFENGG